MAPPTATFLSLPKSARTRILYLSDLVRPCYINLLQPPFREANEHYSLYPQCNSYRHFNDTCICAPLDLALFLVSKQISEEALAVFFSFSKFYVYFSSPESLRGLMQCRPQVLRLVRSLLVSFGRVVSEGLSEEGSIGEQLSALWAAACDYLGGHLTPGLVRFSLQCELSSMLAADRVTSSLELLPVMATCGVRLGLDEDKTFQALARRTVQRIMRHDDEKQFPIELLPSTLRARILYFTDIVARPRALWHARHGKMCIYNGKLLKQPHLCCGQCSDAEGNCTCNTRPSAFSTTCACVIVPSCFFWLSRSLSDEAISVCYLENDFRLSGDPQTSLKMLQQLPSSSVRLIRSLEYRMDGNLLEQMMNPYHSVHEHWAAFISFVRDNFNCSRLYLHVSTGDVWDSDVHGWMHNSKYRRTAILAPLRRLRGLKGASLDIPSYGLAEREDAERAMVGSGYVKLTDEERREISRGMAHGC